MLVKKINLVAAKKLVKKKKSKTHIFLQLFVIYICNGGEQVVGGLHSWLSHKATTTVSFLPHTCAQDPCLTSLFVSRRRSDSMA